MHPVYDKVMGVGNVTFFSVFPFFFSLSAIKENIPVEFPINLYLTVLRENNTLKKIKKMKNSEQKNMLNVRKKYLKSSNEH